MSYEHFIALKIAESIFFSNFIVKSASKTPSIQSFLEISDVTQLSSGTLSDPDPQNEF